MKEEPAAGGEEDKENDQGEGPGGEKGCPGGPALQVALFALTPALSLREREDGLG